MPTMPTQMDTTSQHGRTHHHNQEKTKNLPKLQKRILGFEEEE